MKSIEFPCALIPFVLAAIVVPATRISAQVEEPIAQYSIDVRLDPAARTLSGSELLTWRNPSAVDLSNLYLHLFPNAFRNSMTKLMRGREVPPDEQGEIDVLRVTDMRTGADLDGGISYTPPGDPNTHDETVMIVRLDRPVLPRDSVILKIEFETRFPESGCFGGSMTDDRTPNEFFLARDWYPKIGVLEDGKWNCQMIGTLSEVYSDAGTYDVTISAPKDFTVCAAGESAGRVNTAPGETTYRFAGNLLHDFAWTASSHFIMKNSKYDFAGYSTDELLITMPGDTGSDENYFSLVDTALYEFQSSYGEFPHPALTVLALPSSMQIADPYCYESFIIAENTDPSVVYSNPAGAEVVAGIGNQYWSSLTCRDETADAWLRGGLGEYISGKIEEKIYGPARKIFLANGKYPLDILPLWSVGVFPVAALPGGIVVHDPFEKLGQYLGSVDADASFTQSRLDPEEWKVAEISARAHLVLATLEGVLGEESMRLTLRSLAREEKTGRAGLTDFEKLAEETSGKKLESFFNDFVFGNESVDFAVTSLNYFKETDLNTGASSYVSTVSVTRSGDGVLPVHLRLHLADGSSIDTVWDGTARHDMFEFHSGAEPVYAVVDPADKIPIDLDCSNNYLAVEPDTPAAIGWIHGVFVYIQNLLLTAGILA